MREPSSDENLATWMSNTAYKMFHTHTYRTVRGVVLKLVTIISQYSWSSFWGGH